MMCGGVLLNDVRMMCQNDVRNDVRIALAEKWKRSLKDVVRCVARCDRWFIYIYVQIYIKKV